ncbi:MAG: hypothetical protein GX029_07215 [Pseudomonadaceae bacterium]|nr:hypothetical protein [Pseudomonadaceae bacterium]
MKSKLNNNTKTTNNQGFIINQGFVLVPIIILMTISLLIILTGSKELHQAVLMHQLKMRKNCLYLAQQLDKENAPNYSHCPPCLKVSGCL